MAACWSLALEPVVIFWKLFDDAFEPAPPALPTTEMAPSPPTPEISSLVQTFLLLVLGFSAVGSADLPDVCTAAVVVSGAAWLAEFEDCPAWRDIPLDSSKAAVRTKNFIAPPFVWPV